MAVNSTAVRIGFINLMPGPERYHGEVFSAFQNCDVALQLEGRTLQSKRYKDEDKAFLKEHYKQIGPELWRDFDALIISGAPVETLEFTDIEYWEELSGVIQSALENQLPMLGICWGGLAIGKCLGIDKTNLTEKVFGVFGLTGPQNIDIDYATVPFKEELPVSIQARFSQRELPQKLDAAGLDLLYQCQQLGPVVLTHETHHHMLCLAHPEYGAHRLTQEWKRDLKKNPETKPPFGVNVNQPIRSWGAFSDILFQQWILQLTVQQNISQINLTTDLREPLL